MSTVIVLPVNVEQIAVAVKQMSPGEQYRLLELVPDLRQRAIESPGQQFVEWPPELDALRAQVMAALGGKKLSLDELFIGGLTIAEYDALSEKEKDELWEQVSDVDLMEMEEVEVLPDALFA